MSSWHIEFPLSNIVALVFALCKRQSFLIQPEVDQVLYQVQDFHHGESIRENARNVLEFHKDPATYWVPPSKHGPFATVFMVLL